VVGGMLELVIGGIVAAAPTRRPIGMARRRQVPQGLG